MLAQYSARNSFSLFHPRVFHCRVVALARCDSSTTVCATMSTVQPASSAGGSEHKFVTKTQCVNTVGPVEAEGEPSSSS
jgi:hypothetical protein